MVLRIWGRVTSINVQKVLWAADEIGLSYERVDVGGEFGKTDTPEYLALNPNKKIPVIQDGDFVLWESNAIVRYLAEAYGVLAPAELEDRALAGQWSDWSLSSLYSDLITNCFHQHIRVTAENRDHALIAAASERLVEQFTILDRHLEGRSFIVGDALSFADIVVGALMFRYYTMPIQHVEAPNVEAWYQRLQERSAYREHVMRDWQQMKIAGA
ncbi:Glutathione S-transferase-like protein [Candidatus Filomicrobium marinum]|uniref:Glutathione S-transferase-like protein n=2 Tax=Filomicrobium TaxID=119044 RepID=A0A0D6JCM2_9HYPH|nr:MULTISPECIES: glutathione S-transferase N-terminal domain-containing protein [Filomicrobium]MCV0370647.1 glutathione S-transferase N-terminal domain-containing protein [Filomicrobium sp.]CFX07303.1 Glutathione S-transferase-like protein [Candidatus Filomicrobium marinum]CPR16585.1 Glutathione S-transferase-like protein [Candidatus Filomicrobium marinum]SDP58040.1 Glutathione S-transferase [Filomicrobium insigne]